MPTKRFRTARARVMPQQADERLNISRMIWLIMALGIGMFAAIIDRASAAPGAGSAHSAIAYLDTLGIASPEPRPGLDGTDSRIGAIKSPSLYRQPAASQARDPMHIGKETRS